MAGYWYNPNIHLKEENVQRLRTARQFASMVNMELLEDDEYDLPKWLEDVRLGILSKKKIERCALCYRIRLEKTVERAKKEGIPAFSTTLLYSRYQFHDVIKNIGFEMQEKYGVRFLYKDLRLGWNEGILLSKEMNLYRQKYCGCVFSVDEAFQMRQNKKPVHKE